nr:PAS domain-containing protein [uncultured Dysosmobacter sp.]
MSTQFNLSKKDHLILQSYMSVLDGLAEFLGGSFEIVLHSLENLDSAAIKVINGHYSGRKEGAPITDLALQMLNEIKHSGNNHKNLVYSNCNSRGTPIRSATLPITGEKGRIIGLICINFYQDVPLYTFIEGLFKLPEHRGDFSETFATNADELIESSILQASTEVINNPSISSVNRNKEIISILYGRDIFRLKNAVPKVAERLGLSKNTVYLHLRHLQLDQGKK